jgi:hypothetical protein
LLAAPAAGWATAGCEVFGGGSVPSKAFAKSIEHQTHTPSISL